MNENASQPRWPKKIFAIDVYSRICGEVGIRFIERERERKLYYSMLMVVVAEMKGRVRPFLSVLSQQGHRHFGFSIDFSRKKRKKTSMKKKRESSVCEAIKVKNILCDFIMCEVQRSESKKIANSLIRCARGVPFENLYFSIDNNDLVACSNGHSGTYFVLIFTFRFVPFNFQQRGFAAVCLLYSLYFFFSSLVDFGKELFSFLFSIFVLLFR